MEHVRGTSLHRPEANDENDDDDEADNDASNHAPRALLTTTTATRMDGLVEWASSKMGVSLTNCEPSDDCPPEGIRGIVATEDLEPGSIVVRVPRRAILTPPSPRASGSGSAECGDEDAGLLSPTNALALRLLRERDRGDASPFAAYVGNLPKAYTNLHHWTEDVAAELQCEDFLRHYRSVRSDVLRDFFRAVRAPGWRAKRRRASDEDEDSLLEDYLWARSTILSRSVYMPGTGDVGGLCPLGE